MSQKVQPNRRQFMATTAAGATLGSLGLGSLGYWSETAAKESSSANNKLKILCVGTANRAAADIQGVEGEDIVGLCDVDRNFLNAAASKFPSAKTYADYREMIAAESDRADAIVIATTDHQHAPAAIRAINAGLHCYCEKPLTHTVREARIIAEAAKAKGLATQLGTQIHAEKNYRRVVEIIRAGVIGDVGEVHVWVGKGWGGGERPAVGETPPEYLSWDLWLGPAPQRPYVAERYHPFEWRRWWEFGQGTLGDMACHYMDLPFWALDLKHPTSIVAEGPPVHPETCPLGLKVQYQFPSRNDKVGCSLTWYDGDMVPKELAGESVPGSGVMFIGSEGNLYANYGNYKLFPQEKFADFVAPPESIPNSIGHHAEWIKACKDGSPTTCNFVYSGALTETVLLGNVAYRVGKKILWDSAAMKTIECPEADRLLTKEYRPGWEV